MRLVVSWFFGCVRGRLLGLGEVRSELEKINRKI